ncbi:SRPBCC family protein [Streptomyces sp. Isolate_45]|uniref:SRPBCC family protein n=1 Tax=unclassified Streptomyces TaxID=2593676 RepID=UPI0024819866|nr:SRPBCC family protein [Streptomyces sp. Isolate_45]MDA5281280.1 SRPBCC family protein [Streptomyces sp. Isolate_45]
MQRWTHYRFRSVWDLQAPPALVFSLLEDPGQYPSWWPQVRRVEPVGEDTGRALIRSVLPYGMHVGLTGLLRDPARGVLEVALRGDIEGWARWTVRPRGGPGAARTRALYEQEVDVTAPLLRRLSVPARPLFHLNHALMMRAGRRGLAARLTAGPEAV